jgi:hypothetical protein
MASSSPLTGDLHTDCKLSSSMAHIVFYTAIYRIKSRYLPALESSKDNALVTVGQQDLVTLDHTYT